MRTTLRRTILAIAAALTLAIGSASLLTPANAQSVQTGSFALSGDPGDYITGGQSYSYSTAANDIMNVGAPKTEDTIDVLAFGANGGYWELTMAAPQGQTLTPGTYTGATKWPYHAQPGVPSLNISGNDRVCTTVSGSFTIDNVTFGPNGYVQTLDATYEQHCDGSEAALRGDVHIANPPAPPLLDFGVVVSTSGTASTLNGSAIVHGTLTCTKTASVEFLVRVTAVVKRVLVRGTDELLFDCTPGHPVAWTAAARPDGTTPFQKGDAEVEARASGYDYDYAQPATVDNVTAVQLLKG